MNDKFTDTLRDFVMLVGVCPKACKRGAQPRHCDCWMNSRVGTQVSDMCCFCGLENHAKLFHDKPELLVARNKASMEGKRLQKIEPEPLKSVKSRMQRKQPQQKEDLYTGPTRLGPIADAIRNRSEKNKK